MDLNYCTTELSRNVKAMLESMSGISSEQAKWQPAEGKWSLLEIACHLADEEREDFRARIKAVLDSQPFAPIDPEGWVRSRDYNSRDLQKALQDFSTERSESIAWLMKLTNADWSASASHPDFGTITAGELLASWVAHDLLHIRQIARTKLQYLEHLHDGISTGYAGQW